MDGNKKLEILIHRNKFMEKMALFSIVLSILSNISAGLPWSFIGIITFLGGLIYLGLLFLNRKEKIPHFVPIYLSTSITILTFLMIYQDQNFLTYFTVFFNLVLISFYQNKSTMIIGGSLQLILTVLVYMWFGERVFPNWKVPDIVSLGSFIVIFTGLFVYQSIFFNRLQLENHLKEIKEEKQKRKIQGILTTIKDSVVGEFSKELQQNIEGMSNISTGISNTFTGVAVEMNHQFNSIEDIQNSVRSTNNSVNEATETAKRIQDVLFDSISSIHLGEKKIEEIHQETDIVGKIINDTSKTMEHLTQESKKIVDIIESIDDFSQKTKFLSINAAIESTKTNDKGFMVIANEIRELAMSSEESTAKVTKILEGLKQNTEIAEMQTLLGKRAVAITREKASEMLELFKVIKENTGRVEKEVKINKEMMNIVEKEASETKQQAELILGVSVGTKTHIQDVLQTLEVQKEKVQDIQESYLDLERSLVELYRKSQEEEEGE